MTTKVPGFMVELESGRTLASKLTDVISCLDYGATIGGSAASNTTAINDAVTAAAAATGFVIVPYGVDYTEASLVLTNDVQLLVFGEYGTLTILSKDHGSSPIARGGLGLKSQGTTAVILRGHDAGVTADPYLEVVDAIGGDVASIHAKYLEVPEMTAPATPSADKVRIYAAVDGSDTILNALFQDGSVVKLAQQGDTVLEGSATWDPASVANGAKTTTTITITGAVLGDFVIASFSLDIQSMTISGYVSAANTVTVVLANNTGGAVDLSSGTVRARVYPHG